mmetsp:Transcript_50739/g.169417  ORF Transcript_50739/g.169417 Transcript_50739/m.169417 type:complete len:257 (+) Transcript_50739:632-1402(+)
MRRRRPAVAHGRCGAAANAVQRRRRQARRRRGAAGRATRTRIRRARRAAARSAAAGRSPPGGSARGGGDRRLAAARGAARGAAWSRLVRRPVLPADLRLDWRAKGDPRDARRRDPPHPLHRPGVRRRSGRGDEPELAAVRSRRADTHLPLCGRLPRPRRRAAADGGGDCRPAGLAAQLGGAPRHPLLVAQLWLQARGLRAARGRARRHRREGVARRPVVCPPADERGRAGDCRGVRRVSIADGPAFGGDAARLWHG